MVEHFHIPPPQEGAPKNEKESVIAAIPEMVDVMNDIGGRKEFSKTKWQHELEKIATSLAANPERLKRYLDAAHLLDELPNYGSQDFLKYLNYAFEKITLDTLSVSSEYFDKLLTLMATRPDHAHIGKIILKKMLNGIKNEKQYVDWAYDLLLGATESGSDEAMTLALSILSFSTPLADHSSRVSNFYRQAIFSEDDDVLRKVSEIDSALYILLSPQEVAALDQAQKGTLSKDAIKIFHERAANNPKRMEALQKFYRSRVKIAGGMVKVPEDQIEKFPFNVFTKVGPVRSYVEPILAARLGADTGDVVVSLDFPGRHSVMTFDETMTEDSNHFIVNKFSQFATDKETVFVEPEYWRTISEIAPLEFRKNKELQAALAEINVKFSKEMALDSKYSLSPRGDQVNFTDKFLTDLGFEHIKFNIGSVDKTDVELEIKLGKIIFKAVLDENHVLRDATGKAIPLSGVAGFLRHVILSHLHEIKCTDRVMEKSGKGETNDDAVAVKKFAGRRAHLRTLLENQSPALDSCLFAYDFGFDLPGANAQRKAASLPLKTFVRPSEPKDTVVGPVISTAPEAMSSFNHLILETNKVNK